MIHKCENVTMKLVVWQLKLVMKENSICRTKKTVIFGKLGVMISMCYRAGGYRVIQRLKGAIRVALTLTLLVLIISSHLLKTLVQSK